MKVAKKSKNGFQIEKGNPMSMGITFTNGSVNFAISIPNEQECSLNLYHKTTGELAETIHLDEEYKTGSVFAVTLKNHELQEYAYKYQVREKEFIDPYTKIVYGRETYGKLLTITEKNHVRGGFLPSGYEWQEESALRIPYYNLIIYKMHVRGFTKHSSSQVLNRGTYLGVIEKIPYLKELGINCIQMMPVYEYNEILEQRGMNNVNKVNYWGYSDDNAYFAPKSSYAANPDNVVQEFKFMVNSLHRNGIEVVMEMNFIKGTNLCLIQDCLRYWTTEYHIDGFKINADVAPTVLLATDPILCNTKLLASGWDTNQIYEKEYIPKYKNLAEYNDAYSVDVKRFLRADEEQVGPFAARLKHNPGKCGVINYITNHDGFTMMDLYSFDLKHNEANGENNYDGCDYNYSWNCGEEGTTKRKKILDLRIKQIKNAFTTLLFSQGTPLIMAGDEFCNSQSGNNNAYCLDNEISWLDWNLLKTNEEIFNYIKQLIQLRKEHPILHMECQLRNMDYISCGLPDISYHGTKAWFPDYSHYSRMLGVLLSGKYVKINRKDDDWSFYIGFNMHWDKHEFDLPKLPGGMQWYVLLDTNATILTDISPIKNQKQYEIMPRTIMVFIGK